MRAVLSLLMLSALSAAAVPTLSVDARSVDVPTVEAPALVTWRDLSDNPCRWLGRKVRVRMQFESELADWNPYMTRFGRGQFDALRGWSDGQFPWIEAEYNSPEVLFFVRKGSAEQHALDDAATYSRYEFTVVVREVFLDTPWAEIVAVHTMPEQIREATVIHAARAIDLMEKQAWRLARLELDVALEAPLPEAAGNELKRLVEICGKSGDSTVK
ncbi:MAG: hypothetical protein JNL28_03795 [Planctomycetes bacterium]|nr:hypothetical protein [Planctomycetota bacterium]